MERIKAVEQAYATEPTRWVVNEKSRLGIQSIRKEVATTKAPPDFEQKQLLVRAYDKDEKLLIEWPVDSVAIEYF